MLGDRPRPAEERKLVRMASAQSAQEPPRRTCWRSVTELGRWQTGGLARAIRVEGRVVVVNAPLRDTSGESEEAEVVRRECARRLDGEFFEPIEVGPGGVGRRVAPGIRRGCKAAARRAFPLARVGQSVRDGVSGDPPTDKLANSIRPRPSASCRSERGPSTSVSERRTAPARSLPSQPSSSARPGRERASR